ncbi:hypothetical protein ACWCYK_31120 [Streptomyces lydicamycinicus]
MTTPEQFCPACGARLRAPRVRGEGAWNQHWRQGLSKAQQFIAYGDLEADVRCPCGTVVELQNGPLSRNEIEHRERVYGNMVWLFHAVEAHAKSRLRLLLKPGKVHVNFNWQSPRLTIDACRRDVYLDLGASDQARGLHLVLKASRRYWQTGRLLGSGRLYTAQAFHSWMAHGVPLMPWTPENDISDDGYAQSTISTTAGL